MTARIPLTLTLGLLLAAGSAAAAEPVRPWGGPRTVVKTKHLKPAMKDSDEYWDKYTFNGDFGDRGSFYFSIGIANLGVGDHKLEAKSRLSVDGHKFEWKHETEKDGWKNAGGETFQIDVKNAQVSGTPERLVFKNEVGGDAFEVVFTPIARAWRPRGGQVQFGKDSKAFDVTVFPLSKVEARYRQNGGEWKTIEGKGWGSHTWGDEMMYSQARWTLDFHAQQGEYGIYMRELGLNDEYGGLRIPYLLIVKGSEVLIESFDYQFNPTALMTDEKHENKYRVPESFTLQGKDAEDGSRMFRAAIKKSKLEKRKDYLEQMGGLKAAVVGRYSKPVLYDYLVDFTFEVKSGAETQQIKGSGTYEVNHLNK